MSPKSRRPNPDAPTADVSALEIAEAEAAIAAGLPETGPGALRRVLGSEAGFATVVELVPWAGELGDARGQKPLRMAADLAGNPRITALSVTDNAGGHARLSPHAPGEALRELGHDAIVHVACRDRNRNGMQSMGWDLLSRGLTSVLAITGDYPVAGYEGLPEPVFDIDSVALLELLHELGTAGRRQGRHRRAARPRAALLLPGLRDRSLQAPRARPGAPVPQARAEAPQWRGLRDHPGRLRRPPPGRPAALDAPRGHRDARGRQRVHPLGARGEGVQREQGPGLRGHRRPARARGARGGRARQGPRLLPRVRGQAARREPRPGLQGDLHLRAPRRGGGGPGPRARRCPPRGRLALARARRLLRPPGRLRAVRERRRRAVHRRAQPGLGEDPHPGSPGPRPHDRRPLLQGQPPGPRAGVRARLAGLPRRGSGSTGRSSGSTWASRSTCSSRRSRSRSTTAATAATARLPDIAYLCPESHCQKNQRNGPCGGARDGHVRGPGHTCVWADAYRRLKPYGEERTMLERPVVVQDNDLRRTSAWGNTFLGRDHYARRVAEEAAHTVAESAATPAVPPAAAPSTPEKGPHS